MEPARHLVRLNFREWTDALAIEPSPPGGAIDLREAFYQQERARLAGYFFRRVHDHRTAAELAQDAFMKLFAGLWTDGAKSEPEHVVPTLYTIAHNEFANWCRRNDRRPKEDHGLELDDLLASPDWENDLGNLVITRVIHRVDLERALLRLAPRHREAVTLRWIDGIPREAVARLMGVGEETVKKLLQEAKKTLMTSSALTGYDTGRQVRTEVGS